MLCMLDIDAVPIAVASMRSVPIFTVRLASGILAKDGVPRLFDELTEGKLLLWVERRWPVRAIVSFWRCSINVTRRLVAAVLDPEDKTGSKINTK